MQEKTMEKIRVVIHSPDRLTHLGLTNCLDGDKQIVETGDDKADVAVIVIENADISTMKELQLLRPEAATPLLLIVGGRWHADISAAVEQGVRGVLWRRHFSATSFIQAVRAVGSGGGYFPTSLQGALIGQIVHTYREVLAPQDLTPSGFTNREIDALLLVSEGFDLQQIAEKLHYSERTVKNILYQFMKRFNLHNRAHAVAYAIRSGLI
ncbi:helix-turn-helix transcriptional regulator [Saccharopolyspora pogona]|uniref:helix-turn-helix transcriptional regulator n=1 Tax=Saccharopolyspora pogona TaxID=333966 RepID=UPI001CC231F1|nr:response regulator transcription factor [Saccharopolyspora pogona]